MPTFHLGGPRASDRATTELRGAELTFTSPRGVAIPQRLLIEALPKDPPGTALCGMDTEGATALAARAIWPQCAVRWFHLDAYVARKVGRVLLANGVSDVPAEALEDPPPGPFDLVALPFPSGGEALLMRDLLEQAHDRLRLGGRLVAATDRGGAALREAIRKAFGNVTPAAPTGRRGACFYAERKRARPAATDRSHVLHARFAHGDDEGETEVLVETRPGTFSHGRVDRGTRALAESVEPRAVDSVLDLGSGCGILGLYLALRLPGARVVLVDSNVRAAGCARRNAERNGVASRVDVLVRADVEDVPPAPGRGGYALCVSNPPYFGDFRIARSFVDGARRALRPGGRFVVVVRLGRGADAHAELLRETFGGLHREERHGYGILVATRP